MPSVVIIGGGAAGMFAAGTALKRGFEVTVIDKNEKPARKVMITGKGRCNLTNNCDDIDVLIKNVSSNPRFMYSAFRSFMPKDTMETFESLGVPLKTERGNRVFPISDKASDIVDALKRHADGAKYVVGQAEYFEIADGKISALALKDGRRFIADNYILASGGMSYSSTGSSGDGYRIAKSIGHTVTDIKPSLVPLKVKEGFCSLLQGLSLKNVTLSLFENDNKKAVFEELGEMLFTHFGVSGPLVLSASAHIKNFKNNTYKIQIDLKPALSEEQLDKRICRDFSENSNKDFANSLNSLLPKKMIPVIVKLSGIDANTKVNQITKPQRLELVKILKHLTLTVTDFQDIEQAVITAGGVSTKEINPKTMGSKLYKNLHFAGEVIDVDAYTGGFNLQIAFSTAYAAANALEV